MAEEKKERKLQQVATPRQRKETLADKVSGIFFSEDAATVGDVIWNDYIIPGIKNAALSALEMLLFGNRGGYRGGRSHVPYNRYYESGNGSSSSSRRVANTDRTSRFDYSEYEFRDLGEVNHVITEMEELVREDGYARVTDLNQLIGISGKFTDNKWGWNDCRDFGYKRTASGYILNFADPIPLNN